MMPEIEPIVGRYLRLQLGDRPHRLYFEEAGSGIPLVCLHAAGSDARQFLDLMHDPAVTDHFRVLAFDMPWHGRSTPPPGWQREEYRLTTAAYAGTVRAFCRALGLDRPVLMGCSIGGRILLELAIERGSEFRALIGLAAADLETPWTDDDWRRRTDIRTGEDSAALVAELIAPRAPEESRFETLWSYLQSGPGVFKGDLYFYRVDGDLRTRTGRIDTTVCPLYLLTGADDVSCTPEETLRTARAIAGAEVTIMEGLGHFPMSEDPRQFRRYLLPVLERIRTAGAG
jgi:pimeloyl-ACP methyl ester carboxylesterase